MGKLTDIKETDFGIDNVVSYRLERARGSAGVTFEIQIAGWVDAYTAGSYITIRGISGFVTQREYVATEAGRRTVIHGVDTIADVLRRAPTEALIFMSMTQSELDDFNIANSGSDGKIDYSKLDYVPFIQLCEAKTLIGGWCAAGSGGKSVIKALAEMMGLDAYCTVTNYWLRQVRADIQSSYYDTIMSLVSFLEPIVYVENDILYILDAPVRNGTIDLQNMTQFSQRQTFNYSSKSSLIRVDGGLGEWSPSKEKGQIKSERVVILTHESFREKAQTMTVRLKGDVETVKRLTGGGEKVDTTTGELTYTTEMASPKEDYDQRTEIILLDPWGNVKALLSTSEAKIFTLAEETIPVFNSMTGYEYDFLDEIYERPREKKCIQTTTEWTWTIASFPGYPYRKYKTKTRVIERVKVYADNGTLLCDLETHKADVLKLSAEQSGLYAGMMTYIELAVADMIWLEDSEITQIVTNETEIRYRQVTPTIYEKAIFRRRNPGLRRKQGDELRGHETLMVTGRVPRHPAKFRRSQVYYEDTVGTPSPGAPVAGEVPALVVSNPNIIGWDDATAIFHTLRRKISNKKMSIERTYVFPGDLDVDIGWGAVFGEVAAFSGKINAVEASEVSIVGWSKVKDAPGATVMTTVTIEGKQTEAGGGGEGFQT